MTLKQAGKPASRKNMPANRKVIENLRALFNKTDTPEPSQRVRRKAWKKFGVVTNKKAP